MSFSSNEEFITPAGKLPKDFSITFLKAVVKSWIRTSAAGLSKLKESWTGLLPSEGLGKTMGPPETWTTVDVGVKVKRFKGVKVEEGVDVGEAVNVSVGVEVALLLGVDVAV